MPLTLTATEGVFPAGQEHVAFRRLGEAMLRWHGLEGNKFMTAAVIGSIHILPKARTYAAHEQTAVAFVEWRVPPVAFSTPEIRRGYVEEATRIVQELSTGLPKDKIWVNVVHAVEGTWGIAGMAMTSDELGQAIARG